MNDIHLFRYFYNLKFINKQSLDEIFLQFTFLKLKVPENKFRFSIYVLYLFSKNKTLFGSFCFA